MKYIAVLVMLAALVTPMGAQDLEPCTDTEKRTALLELSTNETFQDYLELMEDGSMDTVAKLAGLIEMHERFWEDVVPEFPECSEVRLFTYTFDRLTLHAIAGIGVAYMVDNGETELDPSYQYLAGALERPMTDLVPSIEALTSG